MLQLQRRREERRWTRAALARKADLNATTVGLIEQGRLKPYPVQLQKLAAALGVSAKDANELLAEVN